MVLYVLMSFLEFSIKISNNVIKTVKCRSYAF